jgi:hypothetical protein
MFAYMMAEWREWSKGHLERTILTCVGFMALGGILLFLHPFGVMVLACLESIWLGWYLGNRYWRGSRGRVRFLSTILSPAQAVAGKAGAALLIALSHALAIAPPIVIAALLWGMAPGVALQCLAIGAASFLLALAIGFFFSLAFPEGEGLVGTAVMCAWLILSALAKPLRAVNPFIQIWQSIDGSASFLPALCAPVLFAVSAGVFLAAVPLLRRLRLPSHE